MTEKKTEKVFELTEVPIQMGLAIKTPEDEYLTTEQAIVLLLNKVSVIEKALM